MACLDDEEVDMNDMTCFEQCHYLFNQYTMVVSGNKEIRFRYGQRWLEYGEGNARALLNLYEAIRAHCPEAQNALPSLKASASSKRGGPFSPFANRRC